MEKILITGATGFIGSHLTELCVEKGYNVVAFDRYNPNRNLGWLKKSKYQKDINFIFGDIRDYDSVIKAIKDCKIVFHLAAQPLVRYSYKNPKETFDTNFDGSLNILESVRRIKKIKSTIVITTDKVYDVSKNKIFQELLI